MNQKEDTKKNLKECYFHVLNGRQYKYTPSSDTELGSLINKAAILTHVGWENVIFIGDESALYCPSYKDRNNLVNRDFSKFCIEHTKELMKVYNSIAEHESN